jgi:ATP-dependent DNA ligase
MTLENLDQYIIDMRNGGRKRKKSYIRGMVDDWPMHEWMAGLRFLSGEYTSIGIAKKSAIEAVEMYDLVDDFESKVAEHGTVTEALRASDIDDTQASLGQRLEPTGPNRLRQLQEYIEDILSQQSGNDQIATLGQMLMDFAEPHIVTFAVLDDWQTGVSQTTIANALGEAAGVNKSEIQRARALEPDPVEFALAVEEDQFGDLLVTRPGKVFKPMKAKSESHMPENPSDEEWVAEPKYDGYRALVHVEDGEATVYSRRLKDITDSVPEMQEVAWRDRHGQPGSYILDGELLASDGSYTTTSEMVGSTQERDLDDRDEHVTFHAFDVLYDTGYDASRDPYCVPVEGGGSSRRTRLQYVVGDQGPPEYLTVVPNGSIEEMLDYADENDLEGIIAKRRDGTYSFGKRSSDWIKQKNTEVTVDLSIAGFEQGEGTNAGTLGGVQLETADGVYVGNMGTGFTDEQRDHIWQNRGRFEGVTVEVTAEGFGTNDELRFPRFDRLREDDGEPDDFNRVKELMDSV